MPRIRTLKPEHKQHRKVGALSHFLYRLWIGLVTEADDYGRLVADPVQLRILVFPYHPQETAARVQAGLDALHQVGLCQRYVVAGVQYAALPSWSDHQRVSHPAKSTLPAPPPNGGPPEDSGGLRRTREDSGGFQSLPGGSEGSYLKDRKDRKRKERRPRALSGAPAEPKQDTEGAGDDIEGSLGEFMTVLRAAAKKPRANVSRGDANAEI